MTDDTLEITYISVDDLKPYEKNPRINESTIPFLQNSFRNAGFIVPIVVDRNYTIAAGHTRIKAILPLMEAGEDIMFVKGRTVPCVFAESLTEKQIARFRLEDNRVSDLSEWDWDLLIPELEEMKLMDIDPLDMGFNLPELNGEQMEDIEDMEEPEELPEEEFSGEFDGEPMDVVIRDGDVIRMGNHTIVCGIPTATGGKLTRTLLECEEDGDECIAMEGSPGKCQAAIEGWLEKVGYGARVTVIRGTDVYSYKDL